MRQKDASDFVLWKPSTGDQPGWNSPWGYGRPGWHIECSAMSKALCGDVFDIHGGGLDLTFPHHENEVAQSCCANETQEMARYWVHNGFVTVEGERMAKSTGKQISDYKDIDVSDASIDPEFLDAICDDMNTPRSIAALHAMFKAFGAEACENEKRSLAGCIKASSALIGLLQSDPQEWLANEAARKSAGSGMDDAQIDDLIARRNAARDAKDFALADQLRDEIAAKGVVIQDSADGTTWSYS